MPSNLSIQTTRHRRSREERIRAIEARQQALRQRAQTRLNQLMARQNSLLQDQEKQARENDDLALIRAIHRVAPDWECSTIIGALSSAYAECLEDPTYLVEITEHGAELLEKEKSD